MLTSYQFNEGTRYEESWTIDNTEDDGTYSGYCREHRARTVIGTPPKKKEGWNFMKLISPSTPKKNDSHRDIRYTSKPWEGVRGFSVPVVIQVYSYLFFPYPSTTNTSGCCST